MTKLIVSAGKNVFRASCYSN